MWVPLLPPPQAQDALRSCLPLHSLKGRASLASLLSVAARARAVNQWLLSPVLVVPPSNSTEASRKGHLVTAANGKLGRSSLAAAVPQWRLGLRLGYPGAEVALQLPPRSCNPRPYPSPVFKLPAPQQPRCLPRSLRGFCRSLAPALAARRPGSGEEFGPPTEGK